MGGRFADAEALRAWAQAELGLKLASKGVCRGHCSPLEYLWKAYSEPAGDLVVWAPRGGGKTRMGAVATLLDLLDKAPCEVRILGGSLEQSLRMWDHLYPDVERLAGEQIEGRRLARRIHLENGSSAAVLTQSQRAVRGLHVQKMRCDEVEMFDRGVWEAAQLVTRSTEHAAGAIEALSTMHKPWGLMRRIVEDAERNGTPILKWCLLDILERCEGRQCSACILREDCDGVAQYTCDGFLRIEDAIAMKRRVGKDTWNAEMLCRRPSVSGAVFPMFDPCVHVRQRIEGVREDEAELWLAIDFGFSAPFVCLWIRRYTDGTVHVIDEYVRSALTMHRHIEVIQSRTWGHVVGVACDPAGNGRNDQTGRSNVELLKQVFHHVKSCSSRIADGLELLRSALQPAEGPPKLYVHERCAHLRKALAGYHYIEPGSETAEKDGEHDHLIDALRYFYMNQGKGKAKGPARY